MAYSKTVWVNDTTPAVNATNLNKIEQGIFDAAATADAAIPKSTVTTKGDLLAATASATYARVAVGTDGQVLTADSASAAGVKWSTPATGGVSSARQIIAGTGLTGGGDLTADRTLAVSYGTTSGTAAAGNDSRITGALQAASNLSDVGAKATARSNLDAASNKQGGAEVVVTNATATGALSLDASAGSVFALTLTGNVTSFAITNPAAAGLASTLTLRLKQDATGSRTVTWGSAVKWAGGTAPTLSTTANAVDFVTLVTIDGGTTWYGFDGGKAFA